MDPLPAISLTNHSGRPGVPDLTPLQALADACLPLVWQEQKPDSVLPGLDEIEITLVDDPTITRVHAEFMDIDEPTDVITFHHGEILISVDTARLQAATYQRSLLEEISLYIIHGLLHLAGHHDKDPADFHSMAATQERILSACLRIP